MSKETKLTLVDRLEASAKRLEALELHYKQQQQKQNDTSKELLLKILSLEEELQALHLKLLREGVL